MKPVKDKYVIAHDVGTSSVKTALISSQGEVIAHASFQYGFSYPKPGWVEQDPEDYWKGSVENTRAILAESKIPRDKISGIVYSTQAMGIIPVNKEGKALKHNISWVDGRAEEEARWLMGLLGGKRIFENLFGIVLTGKDVIPKLRWLRQHEPGLWKESESILDVNAYLKFRATGIKAFEWSGACSYGFNLKRKDWERLVFKTAGIDMKKLPPLCRSTDMIGKLTPEAAAEMDLSTDVPVYGGCDDTQSAAVGAGAISGGSAHIYLGTSAWAGITTARLIKHKNGAAALQSADAGMNLLVGITESAGSNLEWMIEKFYKYEKNDEKIKNIFAFIEEETRGVPPGSDHLVFTPWMLGERCPVSSTTTRGTIFNLGLEHNRGHLVNAMLEGVGFNLRWIFENFKRDYKFNPKRIRAIGGGSVNGHWMQGIANITGKTVETTSQPTMAGALGAAACVFVGDGTFDGFHNMDTILQVRDTYPPNQELHTMYTKLFASYKDVYSGLKKAYFNANFDRFNS